MFFMFTSGFLLVLLAIPNFISTFSDLLDGGVMWSYWVGIFELNFAVVIACLPSARKTWNKIFKKMPSATLRRPSHWAARPFLKKPKPAGESALEITMVDEE